MKPIRDCSASIIAHDRPLRIEAGAVALEVGLFVAAIDGHGGVDHARLEGRHAEVRGDIPNAHGEPFGLRLRNPRRVFSVSATTSSSSRQGRCGSGSVLRVACVQ